ncbi:MAG: nucleobase:cation symporter-2 family protein [Succinivibrio sp.]
MDKRKSENKAKIDTTERTQIENAQTHASALFEHKTELIYALDDRPPLKESLFAAFQHLLAIFVAIITPPLIIAGALKLDLETTGYLISMSLLASGISTFIQCRRIGPVGCGLLCIQGTSFSFISPIIGAGLNGGLSAIFGAVITGSVVEMFISRILRYTRKIITPLVSGIVVTLIGLSLIKVGVIACGGGFAAKSDGSFGSLENLGLSSLVIICILFFNRSSNKYLRMSSIVIGLIIGFIIAYILGRVDFNAIDSYGGFNIPVPFKYGLSFDPAAIIGLGIVYLITAIEAYGDITANSLISGQSIEGEAFQKRSSGGILADGFNSMLSGIINSFPNSIFAQNNGMIQLTGVASRYVGYFIALFLVILGLFPVVGKVFALIPDPVLGGATLLMFGTVAAAGIKIIATQKMNRKAILVMALSFSFGLSVELVPEILSKLPEQLSSLLSSGITTGGIVAIISNMLIRIKE